MRQLVHLERTRQQHWALAAGCLAALVGMQVHGLLDAVTWGNKLAFIPWLIFAQIIVPQKSFVPHSPVREWDKTFLDIYTLLYRCFIATRPMII